MGKRIQPERQLEATCEIFKNAGRMGPRQFGFMHEAARELYLEHGVLTADKKVAKNPTWNHVRDADENDVIDAARRERGLAEAMQVNVHVDALEPFERQALSVHRSKAVDMTTWVERLEKRRTERESKGDRLSAESLQGALLRLRPFTQGEMARMYGSGEGTVAVEELGLLGPAGDQWGISVLEGGAE
ncbi:MAG: hypothetical protein GY842_02825, partial [bacterium]|nr:hypothetical protein [bacterium]